MHAKDQPGRESDSPRALDLLARLVSYFDTRLPVAQRAQIAAKAIPEARELLVALECVA